MVVVAISKQTGLQKDTRSISVLQDIKMNLHTTEVEERAKLLKSLKTETEDIKNRLVAISARCHELENIQTLELQVNNSTSDVETVQELLRDALEKNQQWLAYDQQREAYVTAVLARIYQLEQQQGGTRGAIQQQHKEADSEERSCLEAQMLNEEALKTCDEKLKQKLGNIAQAQTELCHVKRKVQDKQEELCQLQIVIRGKQKDLDQVQMHIKDKQKDLDQVQMRIQEKQEELDQLIHKIKENSGDLSKIQDHFRSKRRALEQLQNEIQAKQFELDQVQSHIRDKQSEMSQIQQQLKDQRRELKKGIQLQEVLHQQHEEQRRIAGIDKQVHDMNIASLSAFHKSSTTFTHTWLDKAQGKTGAYEEITNPGLVRQSFQNLMGSPRVPNPLDESFLECPNCRIQYPASRHRELVMHIDKCCG